MYGREWLPRDRDAREPEAVRQRGRSQMNWTSGLPRAPGREPPRRRRSPLSRLLLARETIDNASKTSRPRGPWAGKAASMESDEETHRHRRRGVPHDTQGSSSPTTRRSFIPSRPTGTKHSRPKRKHKEHPRKLGTQADRSRDGEGRPNVPRQSSWLRSFPGKKKTQATIPIGGSSG